jgi:hypothetical protein
MLACLVSGPTLFFFLSYLPLTGDDQSLYSTMIDLSIELLQ